MTSLRLVNLSQPDSKKWKLFADILLYALPEIAIVMLNIPISDTAIMWINTVLTVSIIAIKAITKFTAEVPVEIVPIAPAK